MKNICEVDTSILHYNIRFATTPIHLKGGTRTFSFLLQSFFSFAIIDLLPDTKIFCVKGCGLL